jgi:colanic acid biosynthesis glycosyl transferase WcaI
VSDVKLRVTIIGLHYAPESSGNAPYTTRLAEQLAATGHEVQVLTGYPHYPEWKLSEGYGGWNRVEEINGVAVKRLRHFIPNKVTTLTRLHMELSFGLRVIFSAWNRPDVVLVVSPALFSSAFALFRARFGLRKPSSGIWIQDLYSRGLEETGRQGSLAARLMGLLEGAIVRSASKVTVIHQRFADYLVTSMQVPIDDISVIRNWTHVQSNGSLDPVHVRERFGWSPDDIVVLHAGNMGMKQALQNVIEAARLAEQRKSQVRFVLLGDGNQRPFLEDLSRDIGHIQFISPLSERDFVPTLRSADVLLVNEMEGLREMSVPSKLTSYFSTGQPVIAATESDSATANEISSSGAGLTIPPADPEALLAAAERLGANKDLAAALGQAGRKFSEQNLSESAAIVQYDTWLRAIAATKDHSSVATATKPSDTNH